jgi:hypothetical protein
MNAQWSKMNRWDVQLDDLSADTIWGNAENVDRFPLQQVTHLSCRLSLTTAETDQLTKYCTVFMTS